MVGFRLDAPLAASRRLSIPMVMDTVSLVWSGDIDVPQLDEESVDIELTRILGPMRSDYDFGVCDRGVFDVCDTDMRRVVCSIVQGAIYDKTTSVKLFKFIPNIECDRDMLGDEDYLKGVGEVMGRLVCELRAFELAQRSFAFYHVDTEVWLPSITCFALGA